ncbi:hypothetical protein FEM48_Zijuj04G0190600 [Ziziphus jujuba var. spinosa]|uniref:Uncharacterized protein n=1 Tax=Ziziphus jujuba var. spinosa TaxID=714518 RepID=A0A978VLM4_ZIZJJ|nr:hypothetical protein FEM48_Zijuj04G0190600 [Ziziphus jujuba var. spinosa]
MVGQSWCFYTIVASFSLQIAFIASIFIFLQEKLEHLFPLMLKLFKITEAPMSTRHRYRCKIRSRYAVGKMGFQFHDKPLWNHIKDLNVAVGEGGTRCWTCNYCSKK